PHSRRRTDFPQVAGFRGRCVGCRGQAVVMAAKDDTGRAGEERAARHLVARGYEILDRNWRCPQGELDIVAERGGMLCFIEVKTRRGLGFGHPFEAIDERKRRRLWRLA